MTKDSLKFVGLLDELLGPKKKAPKQDPYYGRFRRFCKKHGITYTVDGSDGYIDFTCANGGTGMFAAYNDWCEAYIRISVWMAEGQDPNSADEMPWPGDEQPTQPPGTDEAQRLAEANARFAERRAMKEAREEKARWIAKQNPPTDLDELRDFVDIKTGGELDADQLDSMVYCVTRHCGILGT